MPRSCLRFASCLLAAVSALVGGTVVAAEPLPVAASVPPHAWLVRQVGRELVDVTLLVPPGASPATHQPSDREATRALRSRVVFRTGVPFENGPWFSALARRADSGRGPVMVDLRDGVELRRMEGGHGIGPDGHVHASDGSCCGGTGLDPHTWTDPVILRHQAGTIARALAAADPVHADAYAAHLREVETRLDALHAEIVELLAPAEGRSLIVFHPAWGYFCDRYGLRQVAIEVAGKDPGDRELTRVQRLARETGVRTVFVQPQIRGRGAMAVATAIGGTVETLDPLPEDVEAGLRDAARRMARALAPPAAAAAQ